VRSSPWKVIRSARRKIAETESLVTQPGDWLFDANNYFEWSPGEDWEVIPRGQRDSREALVAAANAYPDAFLEQKVDAVPWVSVQPDGRRDQDW